MDVPIFLLTSVHNARYFKELAIASNHKFQIIKDLEEWSKFVDELQHFEIKFKYCLIEADLKWGDSQIPFFGFEVAKKLRLSGFRCPFYFCTVGFSLVLNIE